MAFLGDVTKTLQGTSLPHDFVSMVIGRFSPTIIAKERRIGFYFICLAKDRRVRLLWVCFLFFAKFLACDTAFIKSLKFYIINHFINIECQFLKIFPIFSVLNSFIKLWQKK